MLVAYVGQVHSQQQPGNYQDLLAAQEVKWDKVGAVGAWGCNFFYGKEWKIIGWEQDFLCTTE
jgi:hypothetical protein